MKKNKIFNLIIYLVCIIAVLICIFLKEYKYIGMGCFIAIGIIAVLKNIICKLS